MFGSTKDGVFTLNIYKPYALFPMSSVLNGKQEKYTYGALTEVRGYFAPKKDFRRFIKKNPDILFDLLKRIYSGLEGFFSHLEAMLSGDAYLRILTQLIIYTKRFGQNNKNRIAFDWHMTHHELASQTGLARETVTREIKKLQDKGLIGYSGKKLFVYELPKLEGERALYLGSSKLPLDKPQGL